MRRIVATGCFVLIAIVAHPRPASAGFWAWLEEWSGPGPFKGYTYLVTACVQDRLPKITPIANDNRLHTEARRVAPDAVARLQGNNVSVTTEEILPWLIAHPETIAAVRATSPGSPGLKPPDPPAGLAPALGDLLAYGTAIRFTQTGFTTPAPTHSHTSMICGYFDQGFFTANADPVQNHPKLRAQLNDIGPSARVADGLDIGGGFGWVSFDANDGTGAKRRPTITPIRIVIRPLLLAVPERYRHQAMGALSVFYKETYVAGPITGRHFGIAEEAFQSKGEMIRSWGLTLDAGALFYLLRKIP